MQKNTVTLNNGQLMPLLGLGVYLVRDSQEAEVLITQALNHGYRSIDTASYYGNEGSVGRGLRKSNVKREEVFITTKLWNQDQRDHKVMDAFEKSLKTLDLDYIDLYLIHWPVFPQSIHSYKIMEEIYQSGRVKSIGVSNFTKQQLTKLMEKTTIVPAVNQVEIHPYLTQNDLIQFCLENHIAPEAWSPLGRALKDIFEESVIINLSQKYQKTVAQIILRWHIQRQTIVIPKSNHLERIITNAQIFDFQLTQEEIGSITALNQNLRLGPNPENFDF